MLHNSSDTNAHLEIELKASKIENPVQAVGKIIESRTLKADKSPDIIKKRSICTTNSPKGIEQNILASSPFIAARNNIGRHHLLSENKKVFREFSQNIPQTLDKITNDFNDVVQKTASIVPHEEKYELKIAPKILENKNALIKRNNATSNTDRKIETVQPKIIRVISGAKKSEIMAKTEDTENPLNDPTNLTEYKTRTETLINCLKKQIQEKDEQNDNLATEIKNLVFY